MVACWKVILSNVYEHLREYFSVERQLAAESAFLFYIK